MSTLNTPLPPVPSAEPSGDEGMALLDYPRAAKRLGVSKRTLWTLVKNGSIPAVRFAGRTVRIDPADLQAFIQRSKNVQQTPGAKALTAALAKMTPEQRRKAERVIAEARAAQTTGSG